jgi:hypothetical protein
MRKKKLYPIFSYNIQTWDIWSINLGYWGLAADKSSNEIIKIGRKESM